MYKNHASISRRTSYETSCVYSTRPDLTRSFLSSIGHRLVRIARPFKSEAAIPPEPLSCSHARQGLYEPQEAASVEDPAIWVLPTLQTWLESPASPLSDDFQS